MTFLKYYRKATQHIAFKTMITLKLNFVATYEHISENKILNN